MWDVAKLFLLDSANVYLQTYINRNKYCTIPDCAYNIKTGTEWTDILFNGDADEDLNIHVSTVLEYSIY